MCICNDKIILNIGVKRSYKMVFYKRYEKPQNILAKAFMGFTF